MTAHPQSPSPRASAPSSSPVTPKPAAPSHSSHSSNSSPASASASASASAPTSGVAATAAHSASTATATVTGHHHGNHPSAVPLKDAWPRIRDLIRRQMSDFAFAFVNDAHLIVLDENVLELGVGTRLVADWLEERYREPILKAVKDVTGHTPTLKLSISGFLFRKSRETEKQIRAEAAAELKQPAVKPTTQRVFAKRPQIVPLDPHKTFFAFVVGDSNRLAHNISQQIVKHPGAEKLNPFFLHGPNGVGKTHLLQAIAQALSTENPALNVLYVPYDYFLGQYVSALSNRAADGSRGIDNFRQQFRGVDVLLVDDMQQMESKRHSQDEFLHTFNDLISRSKQVVLASSLPPRALQKVTPQLVNRFEAGLVAKLDQPDRATRHGMITRRLQGHPALSTPVVFDYLIEALSQDVREMEGQMNKLVCFLSLYQGQINLDVVKKALGEVLPFNKRTLTLHEVETAVVRQYGISSADLHSISRKRNVAFARQVCMYLARNLTNYSLNEIGEYFGGKNHATVVFSENKIKKKLLSDAALAEQIERLTSQLRALSR